MTDQTAIPARSRQAEPPRKEAERTERRRRSDVSMLGRLDRLSVPGKKDTQKYFYRWVTDNGRVQQLTQEDDYDPVTYQELGATPNEKDANDGSVVTRVGDKATGQRMVLLKKRRDWYEGDKAKEQSFVDERMKSMKRGDVGDARGITGAAPNLTYGEVKIGTEEQVAQVAGESRRRS